MGTKIARIESYLPEYILTNEELSLVNSDYNIDKIAQKVGIMQRRVVREDETALDIAIKACEKLFENYDKNKIDFILFCTQSPDYILPTTACILQDKLGLPTNIGALDYNLGCSGYIYGLAMAKGLINTNIAKTVLLVTSETYSKQINKDDISNRIIFGDGVAVTILEKSDNDKVLEFVFGTDGSGASNLIVENGGAKNKPSNDISEDMNGKAQYKNNLYMNGPEIFKFTLETVPQAIENVLKINNLNVTEIDYYIFHQANVYMLTYLRKKLAIAEDKFYISMENIGNTVSATIPIALKDAIDRKLVKKGDKVLLCGFGVGYSWGATIIEIQ